MDRAVRHWQDFQYRHTLKSKQTPALKPQASCYILSALCTNLKPKHVQIFTDCAVTHTLKFLDPPEITDSFQPSRSVGRPEVLEKHWSSRTFSLFSSASFLGQSDPPPPTHPPTKDDVCWFSELQERESRPSEHHSRGGEPCSHPSWTLWRHKEDK